MHPIQTTRINGCGEAIQKSKSTEKSFQGINILHIQEGLENTPHHRNTFLSHSPLLDTLKETVKRMEKKQQQQQPYHIKKVVCRVTTIVSKILIEPNIYSFLPRYHVAKPYFHLNSTHLI